MGKFILAKFLFLAFLGEKGPKTVVETGFFKFYGELKHDKFLIFLHEATGSQRLDIILNRFLKKNLVCFFGQRSSNHKN